MGDLDKAFVKEVTPNLGGRWEVILVSRKSMKKRAEVGEHENGLLWLDYGMFVSNIRSIRVE